MSVALHLRGAVHAGDRQALPQVDLTLMQGQWTCLLGPSGAGKSTLLRLVAGLTGPDLSFDGSLRWSGSERVALMAQDDLLLPWCDVRGNVLIGARLRGERPDMARAEALIARVGLAEHATKRPARLSGGQRQRVALARTLMEDRATVLLDEPFGALDALTRMRMQDLAAEMLAGRTVLHVTHDPMEAARLADRILILEGVLREVPAPTTPRPRASDHPATVASHAALLDELLPA